ncbi:MAG TPA: DUF4097 family beta strand repeat-containing protein [Vicinamibacterales bacterium]|jgi:DUF4097 and DUF4098 domain-containing protein YvlB
MHRICAVVAVLASAAPASAQDVQSIADIVNQALREARVEIAAAVAQASQQGQSGRAAAQAAREAERRRREEARRGPEVTEAFSRSVRLGRDGTFTLENVSGDIEVNGGGGSDVRIEATKRARHPDAAEAKAILQDLVINVSERGGDVDVRTEYQRYTNRRNRYGYASVDYTVSVPRDASVMLKSVSGAVKVTNVNGELRAESISGGVAISAARKIRTLKSISGDVQVTDSQSDDLTAGSTSGSVILRNVRTRIVELQSISGDLRLTDVDADHAEMRTVSGNVEYAGRLSRNGRYEFQSHSGNVRFTPMGSPNFSIEATTFSGDVRTDFPLTLQGGSQSFTRSDLRGRRQNQSVRGTVGSGGPVITMQSFSGNIVIAKP